MQLLNNPLPPSRNHSIDLLHAKSFTLRSDTESTVRWRDIRE